MSNSGLLCVEMPYFSQNIILIQEMPGRALRPEYHDLQGWGLSEDRKKITMESLFQKKEKKPKKKKKKATGKAGGKVKVFGGFFDAKGQEQH